MVIGNTTLHVSNVLVRRRGKDILGPISVSISEPGISLIMGPNGSGKTTLLRLMHGLERPRQGLIVWKKNDLQTVAPTQAFVFQEPILLRRSVLENLKYPLSLKRVDKDEIDKRSKSACEKIGLATAIDQDAHMLSGGEKQKLAVARALIDRPQVLFLDEPTASLDGSAKLEIEKMLLEAVSNGTKLYLATHDIGQAKRLGGEVVFLNRGKLVEQSQAVDFFTNPKTDDARVFLSGEILL